MTKRIALIAAIFAMFMLCAACGTQTEETTLPTPTETTSVPTEQTSTPTIEPATEVTTEPTTEPTEPPHTHNLSVYDRNHVEHQLGCHCGARFNEAHALDETGYCSVCDASIRTDENGEYIVTITYETGMTSAIEKFYKPVESGSDEFYHYRSFYYDRDGYWNWIEYGTHGHITSHTYYTPDGTVTMVETRSYRFFEDGGYELDIFEDGELVEERTYMLRDDGSLDQIFYIRYGWSLEDGEWVDWITAEEYELDEAGNLIFFRDYDDGNLRFEAFFAYDEAGNHYQKQVIRYDQNGQIMYQLYFDPAGNQINP